MTGDNQQQKRLTTGQSGTPGESFSLFFLFLFLAAILSFPILLEKNGFAAADLKQTALEHFDKAVRLRTILEAKPARLRTSSEYLKVINEFRSVYRISPASSKSDDSMFAIAEIYCSMARDLKDNIYYSSALKTYALLRKEYPGSPLRVKAAFSSAEILRKNLRDLPAAQDTYAELVKKYPRSPYARQAKARLTDLKTEMKQAQKNGSKPVHERTVPIAEPEKTSKTEKKGNAAQSGPEITTQKIELSPRVNGKHTENSGKKEEAGQKSSPKNDKNGIPSAPQASAEMAATSGKPSAVSRKVPSSEDSGKSGVLPDELIAENSHVASPKSDGTRSLIRTLGLKIGRIVIDPGHGGHDTGTIGPLGLREKDLVLDIALKLKKLIEDKIGGEVILTRGDDTFIPLESRTEIANQHQADLFISIHANSSRNKKVRGVETFFLNFATSADVEEVAARENATSQKTIFELQDLIQKIALKEKVEESREFAQTIQKSMIGTLLKTQPRERNRGVKQAPFIVLIGANMPSILTEVSFVSNPSDEKLLRTSSYRQKIAEALLAGISNYSQTLSGIKTARNFTHSEN